MQSHTRLKQRRKHKKSSWQTQWEKVGKKLIGLYRYRPSGMYYARVRSQGKVHWESLKTQDLEFAKRKLKTLKERLTHTHPTLGKVTLLRWLKDFYFPTLKGSESTLADKGRLVERIKKTWSAARQPMRDLMPTDIERWLAQQFGKHSTSYHNSALSLVRDAFQKAMGDHVVFENPAAGLKYHKRQKPIRLTPSFEEFQSIVADIRAQQYNGHGAEESGDFIEFLGLAGLGQAEAGNLKAEHVDLRAGRLLIYRQKTATPFWIPIYPQARPLIEKLCDGKKPHQHLFEINQARGALANACKRLDYPQYTQRGLRRMFITRAIEKGIDVKVIAQWQGHKDSGVLILQTYSHVRSEHSNRMAALMTTEQPANVIPLTNEQQA